MGTIREVKETIMETMLLDMEDISLDSKLRENLEIEQVDLDLLAVELEDKFDIDIHVIEVSECKTVQDVVNLVESKE